jgi:hypothetical protein
MKSVPVLPAVFPPAPMNEMKWSTSGSARTTLFSRIWRSRIAGNETSCGASEKPCSDPCPAAGRGPAGGSANRATVSPTAKRVNDQHHCLVSDDPDESAIVPVEHRLEDPLRPVVETPSRAVLGAKQARAHHRGQRERDHGRDADGHAERHCELAEESPDDPTHEQQRNEDGKERNGDRHDGEADLLRPLERRLHRRSPSSMKRLMFSVTTMASSTTNPVEMVSAINDRLSRL